MDNENKKENANYIVKAFENHEILIVHDERKNVNEYLFKAFDVAKVLEISKIRNSTQNFEDDEKVIRKDTDSIGRSQETIFLTSRGVYRLIYNSKKAIAKKFRKWVGDILDDIIFNNSQNIKKQLEEKDKLIKEKEKLIEHKNVELQESKKKLEIASKFNTKKWYNEEPCECVYAYKNNNDKEPIIKIGKAENIKKREDSYMVGNRDSNIFYYKKCYNAKLTEKVVHHILDKHRIQNNKEWFEISEELAIYTIDLVCNFLDGYISCSEELINLEVKEQLSISLKKVNTMNNIEETEDSVSNMEEEIKELTTVKKPVYKLEKRVKKNKLIEQPDEFKTHFDKFVKEYCEVNKSYKCMALDILGAYRMWNKKTDHYSRKNLTTYLKNNFDLSHEYSSEYNTKFHYYIGIRPKEFIINPENTNEIPRYEEFILSECKFSYTYRTTKMILYNEFRHWVSQKYPEYKFSKEEQVHMESYLNRTFVNCKKVHINGGTNGYYGLQLKTDTTEVLGISLARRKKVYKINITTKEIVETYDSLYLACIELNLTEQKLSELVLNNTVVDDGFMYSYQTDNHQDI
jgi:prophage antirepressor-like protein